jgi:ABC-type antimicrobial peptide transport system permease subunit
MEERVNASYATQRSTLVLLATFAAVAILLALIGLFGVVSHGVSRRMHELGIRAALGAQPQQIRRLVLNRAIALIGIGLAAGIIASVAVSRTLRTLLFEIEPAHPPTYAAAALLLATVALAACWIPARRATGADPAAVLQSD